MEAVDLNFLLDASNLSVYIMNIEREHAMTIAQIAARIQEDIDAQCLPFPIHASAGAGEFITLSVHIRNPTTGRESAESTSFPRPLDLVLMDGLRVSLGKMITKANQAAHCGLEAF